MPSKRESSARVDYVPALCLCYAKIQDEGICTWAQEFLTVPRQHKM